jgi:hypothetical protein
VRPDEQTLKAIADIKRGEHFNAGMRQILGVLTAS